VEWLKPSASLVERGGGVMIVLDKIFGWTKYPFELAWIRLEEKKENLFMKNDISVYKNGVSV
jgi:hypothetical protein